jgi:hypothetical protein
MGTFDKLAQQGITYQPLVTDKPKEEDGDFVRGLKKAAYQIPQTAGGAAALVGDLVGSDGLRDYGLGVYQNNTDKIEGLTRDSDSLTNVLQGDASAVDWAQNAAGYVAGQAATALATGGVGGFIGKQLALRGVRAVAERGIKSQMARQVAEQVARRGTIMGAGTTLGASNLMQEAGSIYPDALAQAAQEGRTLDAGDKARVVGSALAAAGVDTAMEGIMAGKLLHGARKPGEGMARAALREIPGAMAREAGTEGIQTGMERYGAGQDLSTAEAIRDYVDSMGVGAVGGGLGGAPAVLRSQKVPESGPLTRAANAGIEQQVLQLTHDPQPFLSFPDGSVGTKAEMEMYLLQFPEGEERTKKRRELMGRDPETGKRPEQPEPEPQLSNEQAEAANMKAWGARHDGVPLDYAQALVAAPGAPDGLMIVPHPSGKQYTVVPSKWLTLDSQAKYAALQKGDAGKLPGPDREAPGGAIRVDAEGGAAPETYGEQVRTTQQQREQAQRELELGKPVPRGTKAARSTQEPAAAPQQAAPAEPAAPTTIYNPAGKPFVTEFSAKRKLKEFADTHELAKVADGWVLAPKAPAAQPQGAPDAQQTVAQADERGQRNLAFDEPGAAVPAGTGADRPVPGNGQPDAGTAGRQDAVDPVHAGGAANGQPALTGDPLLANPVSWVIRNKKTGEVVMETFDRKKVDALNTKKYEAVPIAQHLRELNGKPAPEQIDAAAHEAATSQPFAPESGTLGIPREQMPQVPTIAHGGLVRHLNAQGIEHETTTVDPNTLKPTQDEFSPEKVAQAKEATGDRAVIVSNDGHIIDGHHQVLAAQEEGKDVKAIVLDAPINEALEAVKNSPSATTAAEQKGDADVRTETAPGPDQAQPQPGEKGAAAAKAEPSAEPASEAVGEAPAKEVPAAKAKSKALQERDAKVAQKAIDPVQTVRDVAQARPFDKYETVRDEALAKVKEATGKNWSEHEASRGSFLRDPLAEAIHAGQYAGMVEHAATLPVRISESAIPMDLANQAYRGTSHSPEERGASARRSYFRAVMGLWQRFERAYNAAPEDRKTAFVEAFNDAATRYASMTNAYLSAHSRVASSMIAGPARFPTESNRKKSDTADRRAQEAGEYLDKAAKRLNKVLRGAVDNSLASALKEAEGKLAERERAQELYKATNAALRKGDDAKLAELGYKAEQIAGLKKPDFAGRIGVPDYTLKNNNAEIRRLRDRVEELQRRIAAAEQDNTDEQGDEGSNEAAPGVRMVQNAEANRLQLFFDDKPAPEVREQLKSNGFRWAPSTGAWQRQLTDNALRVAKDIVKSLSPAETAAEQDDTLRASTFFSDKTVEVDGKRRPVVNSKGQLVAPDTASQIAFWKWFSDSAVVDEQGRPLVVYHGTLRSDREQFVMAHNEDSLFRGAYFSRSHEAASEYAIDDSGTRPGSVIPAYLSIKNPAFAADVDRVDAQLGAKADAPSRTEALMAAGFDGYIDASEIVAFRPEQIKSATGNAGTFNPESADITAKAGESASSPMDAKVSGLVREGASVDKVLAHIEQHSGNADYRALATALRALGLKTGILFERAAGTYTGGVDAAMATASYRASTDTAYLHQQDGAEQNALHELVHAATLKALAKGGLAAQQIKSLWNHIKGLPNFAGEYGITNEEEFVAEAYTNPRFRQLLADTPAPGSKLSLWQKLVGIVRILLGKPAVSDNVLEQVMQAGEGLMADNQGMSTDNNIRPSGEAFKRWFGNSKVVDEDGKPLVVYHGTDAEFDGFDTSNSHAWFAEEADYAQRYAGEEYDADGDGDGHVISAFLAIQNPFEINTDLEGEPSSIQQELESVGIDFEKYKYAETAWAVLDEPEVQKAIQDAGYDGIRAYEQGYATWSVFRPEQIKSATNNSGNFDAASADLRASVASSPTERLGQALTNGVHAAVLTEIPKAMRNRLADFRGIGLQALGRRHLVDIYADDFKTGDKESLLARYSKLMQQMDADKNEAGAEADSIADRWGKLKDGDKLADLMHDATLAQIDPAKDYVTGDNRAQHTILSNRYKAMSPEAQTLYREARDAYDQHWKKVRGEIRSRIERALPESPRRAALLAKMDATFYEKVKGVYFPLARFGDYVVRVVGKDGKQESVSFAETMNEAEALRRELLTKFPAADGYNVTKITRRKEFNASRDSVSRGFMQELFGVLEQYEDSAELVDDINQLYLTSLPDLSWAKHGIHRKGTPGFSQDARRAFAQNMFHGARYLAKLRYADRLGDMLTEMQDHVDSKANDNAYDSVKGQQVVDEMVKRHDAYMNPQTNGLSSTLTSLGFIFYLGLSPASAAVNLSQTALVTLPMLAAKYGFGKASAALLAASKQAASNRNDISKALAGDELRAFNDAVNAGVIDVSMAHDLAGIASGDDAKAHAKLRPVMKWASFMFHHGEKFNRQATLIAAYRLARETGMGHDKAYEAAVKEVYDSHFDYSSGNRPRIMQGNVARVVLLFKQYAQNMVYTLSRNAYLASKGDPVARKTIAGLLLSHTMAAGVLGLPVVGALLSAATALGGDDDDPWDAKVALRNYIADLIGQKPAEVMMHGLSRLTPFDISGRVGLDKLLLPDVQEGLEGARAAESWMTAALGPVASLGVSTAKGLQTMAQGQVLRGLEDIMPTALKNPLKALRFHEEGVRDKTGIPVLDDTTATEELGQLLGFSPSRSREAMEGKGAVYQAEHKLNNRRQALIDQYAHARMAGDDDGATAARDQILAFNAKNPTRQITGSQLQQSLRNRNKRIREAEGGLYLPKKHRDVRDLGRFAQED